MEYYISLRFICNGIYLILDLKNVKNLLIRGLGELSYNSDLERTSYLGTLTHLAYHGNFKMPNN